MIGTRPVPPEPMRVADAVIARCRREIESPLRRHLRSGARPLLQAMLGFVELGEGFQWGLPIDMARGLVQVGRFVYIGRYGSFNYPVVIGDLCMLSTSVALAGDDHLTDRQGLPTRLAFAEAPPVTVIEADCWIGHGAIIKAGVTIGRGAVVAAGAVVTRSVEPYTIVAGCPARPLRKRFTPDQILRHDEALFGAEGAARLTHGAES
jgi:acetyltransferase-like isoleucine patch superfamily enzyme